MEKEQRIKYAQEYLDRVRKFAVKMNEKERGARYFERMASAIVKPPNETPEAQSGTPRPGGQVSAYGTRSAELAKEAMAERMALFEAKKSIEPAIFLVRCPINQIILLERYTKDTAWRKVAKMTGYTERRAYQKHRDALDEIYDYLPKVFSSISVG